MPKTICRLSNRDYFSRDERFSPERCGIDHIVVPHDNCVENIMNIIGRQELIEKITFPIPQASITAIKVFQNSRLNGVKLREFPEPELLRSIRFSAIIRKGRFLVPHGDTIIMVDDELYIAGREADINQLLEWASPAPVSYTHLTLPTKA